VAGSLAWLPLPPMAPMAPMASTSTNQNSPQPPDLLQFHHRRQQRIGFLSKKQQGWINRRTVLSDATHWTTTAQLNCQRWQVDLSGAAIYHASTRMTCKIITKIHKTSN